MKYRKLISFAISALCVSLIGTFTAFADELTDESYETESYETEAYAADYYDDYVSGDGHIVPLGDVNMDGKIDSSDASEVLEYYSLVSTNQLSDLTMDQVWAGDVNGDGITDSTDASDILAYYAYTSTLPKGSPLMDISEFIENPPVTTTAATTTVTTTTETTTTTVATTKNYVLAPEGLDPGTKGSLKYIVNTAELTQRDCIRMYNIKNGPPVENTDLTHYLTDDAITALNNFAKEHFTDDMTNYDRLRFTWEWLHYNVKYASYDEYMQIANLSYAEACFDKQLGQCIQYNGAIAEMLAYMGYDVYMIEMITSGQHFRTEVSINGTAYGIEVGESRFDNPPGYYWMWFFDPKQAHVPTRP